MRLAPNILLGIGLVAGAFSIPVDAAGRRFNVPGFDRVKSNVPFDVRVHTGQAPGVVANGDQDAVDRLQIGVQGGELVIQMKRANGWFGGWGGSHHLTIEVTVPSIRAATLNGPGNLDVDHVRGRDASLILSGPGNLRIGTVEAGALDVNLGGPGDLSATGRAGRVTIMANGPGNVRFGRLAARDLDITLNGPGDVDAMANGNARLVLHGPGDIRVGGHPRCSIEKHGPGNVSCG